MSEEQKDKETHVQVVLIREADGPIQGWSRENRLFGLATVTGGQIRFKELAFGGKTPSQAEVWLGIHTIDLCLPSS